jgi:PIN domain nuclease of toxin-antitoxin system
MNSRFLLDTNIVVRWFAAPGRLSREQVRVIREAERRGESLGLSATTLIEIAIMRREGRHRLEGNIDDIFEQLEVGPSFRVLPITIPIAIDAGALSILRDPADRTIVATARIHQLRLLTSDQRIIDSKLVSVIE